MGIHLSVIMPVYNERYLVAECIRRVLAVDSPLITRLDLIVVDDGSTDGTRAILRDLVERCGDRLTYLEHSRNRGKGAAVRTGIAQARGLVTVIQDADLEYNPRDLERLMIPFLEEQADAVFGSRFLPHGYRRVLYFRHSLANRAITYLCNLITDLNLTDMETCYKAVRTNLLQSIPIRSDDFRIEPELTIKLAKRGARIFETPVSYAGRTYAEGKKIRFRDAILAVVAMFRYWLIDDLYTEDIYGSSILVSLSSVPNFNRWMGEVVRPRLGRRILEIGAGIGNLTATLIPSEHYTASDVNPQYLAYLGNYAISKPYMEVARIDLASPDDFAGLAGKFDTAVCLNVLEHIEDEDIGLRNLRSALDPDGVAVILVPQGPGLFGTLDDALGHRRRYTRASLRQALERNGFNVEELFDFNRATVPGWWLNGKVLRRRHFGRLQLKIVNLTTWLMRRLDAVLPWAGTSLIAVARRGPGDPAPDAISGS